jgi:hypothetical protein
VGAALHHLQRKTEHVTDLLTLLQAFYKDKLIQTLRHSEHARWISQYDINNTYQYIINREETALSWVATAITSLGGRVEEAGPGDPPPAAKGEAAVRNLLDGDARDAQAFVDRWRPKVEAMSNARHRSMLRVILGEVLEQKRFFDQALAGELDLLGRRDPEAGSRIGEVLPTRWLE